ncbi:hypothetical protein C4K35_4727 [Pseudomonas chlororaphis subsp. piscium]|uniref:hypothetical protein n=1 Tax=Pseudomonas chlororaphis TaxID=587753 RepID=UPI000F6C0927|nr:hypothetical protein [Pseudomonas chlororaphis]AZC52296.1 hypothetical protein C4K35_4727 [Pseudomonas chlororaphis subsp. piscium]
MKEFWKLYKRSFTGFWSNLNAATEFASHLLVLSLPLTFPVLYPLVMLWQKVAKHD